jgi:hypothetical protein
MSAKLLIGRGGFKRVYLETISIAAEIPRGTERALVQMLFKAEPDNYLFVLRLLSGSDKAWDILSSYFQRLILLDFCFWC